MIWCRFQIEGKTSYGSVEGETVVEVAGSPFEEYEATGVTHPLSQVKLLAPVVPPVIHAAGPNYRGHVEGMANRHGQNQSTPTARRPISGPPTPSSVPKRISWSPRIPPGRSSPKGSWRW